MAVSDEARERIIDIYQNQPQGRASAEIIESLYQDILGRGADPGGLEYYQQFPAHIAARRMYNSEEAREKGSFAPRPGYDYSLSDEQIAQTGMAYQFDDSGMYKQFQDPNQDPESFADIRNQFGYSHIHALQALRDRIKMRAEGDNRAFSPYEANKTGRSESEFNKFTGYVDRLESLYNQGYSIDDINELGRGNVNVTPSFAGASGDSDPYYTDAVRDTPDPVVDDFNAGTGAVANTTNYTDELNQYYRELFGRAPKQAGLDYFNEQLAQGRINPDNLRQALISGAGDLDRGYYEASQAGGPLFTATQELFGRAPSQTGFYNFRPEGAPFTGDVDKLRSNLVRQAYGRGEGMGTSRDYQAYLDSLGIDRTNNPFAIDGGFANVPYGSDLSQYQALADAGAGAGDGTGAGAGTDTGAGTMPGFPGKGGTGGMGGKGGTGGAMPQSGGTYQAGGGYRMPGQYITGNQLYSGMVPYGMSSPMGFGGMGGFGGGGKGGGMGGFGQGMTVPMQPFNYGYSSQYMPNRGLMGGYSTGFGPYGGYQRPRFGGGKGGMARPMPYPMGGGKGGPRIQPYPYPMGGGDIIEENPVVGPNGERLYDRDFAPGSPDDRVFDSSAKPTFDQNLQFILDRVAAGTATPGQQRFYDERYLTGEYLNNPNNFG